MYKAYHLWCGDSAKRVCVRVAALAVAALVSIQGRAESDVSQGISDAVLDARIETVFALNDALSAMDIDTKVDNGVVVLTGTVDEYSDIELAGDIVKSFDGTKSVVNKLTVAPPKEDESEPPAWRKKLDDALLEANIRRRLAYHRGLGTLGLDIDVQGTTVTAKGSVDSESQRKSVIAIIRDTKGVANVKADLAIEQDENEEKGQKDKSENERKKSKWDSIQQEMSDEWLEKRVETSIMLSQNVSILDLDVEVDEMVCVLTGVVSSGSEKELAGRIAMDVGGVEEVVNEIRVVAAPEAAE